MYNIAITGIDIIIMTLRIIVQKKLTFFKSVPISVAKQMLFGWIKSMLCKLLNINTPFTTRVDTHLLSVICLSTTSTTTMHHMGKSLQETLTSLLMKSLNH